MNTLKENDRKWRRNQRRAHVVVLLIVVALTLLGISLVPDVEPAEKSSPGYRNDFPDQDSIEAKEYWDMEKEL